MLQKNKNDRKLVFIVNRIKEDAFRISVIGKKDPIKLFFKDRLIFICFYIFHQAYIKVVVYLIFKEMIIIVNYIKISNTNDNNVY